MHGQFFWYDIMTSDTAAAAKFYGDVVGWGTQDSGTPGYTLFTVDGQGAAGLMPIPADMGPDARPVWMGYVAVDDVDAAVAKLQAEGGKVHKPPQTIPGVITFAVVADPQGAVFLAAKGLVKDSPPVPANGTPGTVGWRELYAGEWTAAYAFYEKMFGWTKSSAVDMGPMGTYQCFAVGGADAGGIMTKPAQMPMPYWGYYFNVPTLGAASERVTRGGGKIMNGPMEVPGGGQWIANCADPHGAVFSLVASAP